MTDRHFVLWDDANEREVQAVGVMFERQLPPALNGEWVEIDQDSATHTLAMVGGQRVVVNRKTDAELLAEAMDARWTAAKAYRDDRVSAGCETPSGRVDTKGDSIARIGSFAGAARDAKDGGQAWSVNWRMEDNSIAALDADQMLAINAAVSAYVAACQDASTPIRAAIYAATDIPAVEAVNISSGYPT